MAIPPVMSTMGVGRGIVFPNDSVWRLQPPATNPTGIAELWNGNSGSTTPPAIMRTGVYGMGTDGTVWEYAPPNLTKISTSFVPTTWNPADRFNMTLSGGNLIATVGGGATSGVRGIAGFSTGKYYLEFTFTQTSGANFCVGLVATSVALGAAVNAANMAVVTEAAAAIWVNGSSITNLASGFGNGSIAGLAVDLNAKLIWFRNAPSGNWNNSGTANPATSAGGFNIGALTFPLYPYAGYNSSSSDISTINCGASTFSGAVPSGFTSGWGTLQ